LVEKFGVLNYKMFLSLPGHVKRKNFIICDEASELEDEIVKQYSVFIDPDRLKLLGVKCTEFIF
jgi:Rad3-related DNA helicase